MSLLALTLLFARLASGVVYPDVYERHALQSVVSRAVDGQLFMFTYVAGLQRLWRDMAVELCDELNRLRYPFVVLTHDAASCDELMLAASAGRVDPPPFCFLDSVLHKTHGYSNNVLTLWIRRYHAAALFAQAGVGITLLDADTVITRDFLPLLKDLEREYALVVLGEGPANGGLWHLRASNTSSAALWVIRQIERRSTLYNKYKVHSHVDADPGLKMDQDILGDALRVAASLDGSAFDFYGEWKDTKFKDHEMWRQFPQKPPAKGFGWKTGNGTMPSPWLPERCAWDTATCERFERFAERYELRSAPVRYADIQVPFDSEQYDEAAPPERVLCAPYWLFSHGDPLVNGFDDQIAVYHLLGVNLWWSDKGSGSHVSRYVQWLARPGMRTASNSTQGHRYVALAQRLMDATNERREAVHAKRVVKHLVSHAVSHGLFPVLPRFPCNASWISRGNESFLGHEDHRVVDDGVWCYPAPAGYDTCYPGEQFVYPFAVPAGAAVQVLDVLPDESLKLTGEQKAVQTECKAYFNELE
jgi:hypothetical protein